MELKIDCFSYQGSKSNENHDALANDSCVFALADGMGGKPNSKAVAELAVDLAIKYFSSDLNQIPLNRQKIIDLIEIINNEIITAFPNAGTTLALVIIDKCQVWCVHIGDSRVYKFQNNKWNHIGEDQNLSQKTGLTINSKILTNFLGNVELKHPDISNLGNVKFFEKLIICSDGFHKMVDLNLLNFNASSDFAIKLKQKIMNTIPEDDYSAIIIEKN